MREQSRSASVINDNRLGVAFARIDLLIARNQPLIQSTVASMSRVGSNGGMQEILARTISPAIATVFRGAIVIARSAGVRRIDRASLRPSTPPDQVHDQDAMGVGGRVIGYPQRLSNTSSR